MDPLIIIGTGLAGFTLAREWRKLDTTTPLRIISSEDGGFYSKPMLSNALGSKKTPQQLATKSALQMAQELNATITPRASVSALDPAGHSITVNGEKNAYAQLVLALGADPIRLPLQGDAAGEVLSVNDLDDYTRFRQALEGKQRVAILGAGLIGCEFANDLLAAGYGVAIIDPGSRPLSSLLPAEAGKQLERELGKLGARWHFGVKAEKVAHAGSALCLTLSDGSTVEADVVLSAIGLRARTALASAAGIAVNRGIVVDNQLRTSAGNIYALGDCAEAQGKVLPFVLPLMQQARTLAKVLAGTEAALAYPVMPVAVKTPACPIVVCPPPPGTAGEWQEAATEQGVRALFHDAAGVLRGFALSGQATAEKNALAQRL